MNSSRNKFNELAALQAVLTSIDLYHNYMMSAYKIARGFPKLYGLNNTKVLANEFIEPHNELQPRHKFTLVRKLKATFENYIVVRNVMEVSNKTRLSKRRKWSTPRMVLEIYNDARRYMVPERQGKRARVAAEGYLLATSKRLMASMIQNAIDKVDAYIEVLSSEVYDKRLNFIGNFIQKA